jgi:hypothetical protein
MACVNAVPLRKESTATTSHVERKAACCPLKYEAFLAVQKRLIEQPMKGR